MIARTFILADKLTGKVMLTGILDSDDLYSFISTG